MEKKAFRCRRFSSDLYTNHRLQAEKISVSFLGQQKDLLLQELPMFPDCDRHHYSLHAVLCMHPPMLIFIRSCCYSKASQLSLCLNWETTAPQTSSPGHLLRWILREDCRQMHWCRHGEENSSFWRGFINALILRGVQFSAASWSRFLLTSGLQGKDWPMWEILMKLRDTFCPSSPQKVSRIGLRL